MPYARTIGMGINTGMNCARCSSNLFSFPPLPQQFIHHSQKWPTFSSTSPSTTLIALFRKLSVHITLRSLLLVAATRLFGPSNQGRLPPTALKYSNNFAFQVGSPRECREEPRNSLLRIPWCLEGGYPNRRRQRQAHRCCGDETVDGTQRGRVRRPRTTIWEVLEDSPTSPRNQSKLSCICERARGADHKSKGR